MPPIPDLLGALDALDASSHPHIHPPLASRSTPEKDRAMNMTLWILIGVVILLPMSCTLICGILNCIFSRNSEKRDKIREKQRLIAEAEAKKNGGKERMPKEAAENPGPGMEAKKDGPGSGEERRRNLPPRPRGTQVRNEKYAEYGDGYGRPGPPPYSHSTYNQSPYEKTEGSSSDLAQRYRDVLSPAYDVNDVDNEPNDGKKGRYGVW